MKKYLIDVTDNAGKLVHKLEIFPGSVTLAGGQTVPAWIVTTKTEPNGSFNSILNGPQLVALASGQAYGTLCGFNLDLTKGAIFQIIYKTGTFTGTITDVLELADPKQAPAKTTPKVQYNPQNPVQDQMNQDAIDYVNKINE